MRRRIHYPNDSVYIGPSPASGYHFSVNGTGVSTEDLATVQSELNNSSLDKSDITNLVSQVFGVQSYYYQIRENVIPVGGYGTMGPLGYLKAAPSQIEFGFDYIINSFQNEYNFGFKCSGENNILSSLIDYSEDSHNFFIKTVKEGYDSIDYTDNEDTSIISFSNCQINSYSFAYNVNSLPVARASFVSDNIQVNIDSLTGIQSPYIDKTTNQKSDYYFSIPTGRSFPDETGNDKVSVLRNGDVSIDVYEKLYQGRRIGLLNINDTPSFLGQKIQSATIQSFDCNLNIFRDETPALGSKILKSRSIVSPLYAELSVSAICNDYNTGSFIDSLEENRVYKIDLSVKKPSCYPESREDFVRYYFNDCYLQEKSYSLGIGSNKTVDYKFVAPIYSEDNDNYGMKISGYYNPTKQTLSSTGIQEEIQNTSFTGLASDDFETYSLGYFSTGDVYSSLNDGQGFYRGWNIYKHLSGEQVWFDASEYDVQEIAAETISISRGYDTSLTFLPSQFGMQGNETFSSYSPFSGYGVTGNLVAGTLWTGTWGFLDTPSGSY